VGTSSEIEKLARNVFNLEASLSLSIGMRAIVIKQFGETELPWEDFAVIPESYATAWMCMLRNLEIAKDQTPVICGATSALGRAALHIGADVGVHIIATIRKKARFEALKELGAHRVEIEAPDLSERIAGRKRIEAVLDLIGNTTFMDSLQMLRRGSLKSTPHLTT
jgi:NADPH2:quinone reductase